VINALVSINEVTLRHGPVITWMGDHLSAGKPATQVNSMWPSLRG